LLQGELVEGVHRSKVIVATVELEWASKLLKTSVSNLIGYQPVVEEELAAYEVNLERSREEGRRSTTGAKRGFENGKQR
jgi:hypothetical protein